MSSAPTLDRQSRALNPALITQSGREEVQEATEQRLGLDLFATLALAAYAGTVAVGFSRVFFGWDFLRDLVLVVIAGHGASYVFRRLRVPSLLAIPLLLAGLAWLVAWMYYPDTLSFVFPLSDTWEAVRADYRVVQNEFQSTAPPVVYERGWAFLAGATTAATVWLSDTFAFRAQARGEALVPGAVLFVFIAALGVDENRTECSLAVIGAGFVALALLRLRLERRPRTVLGRARHPILGATPAVLAAAALVVVGAWALAPHLPGAHAEPLFDTHNGRGGVTEIVSPLVDIRSRIVNQAETEMFVVAATAPSYWRISALPQFDGNRWDVADSEIEGEGDPLGTASPGAQSNDQLITISALDGPLVPAAPEPVRASIRSDDGGISYVVDSAALIKTDNDLDDDDEFAISSAMPRFTAEALRTATSDNPPHPMLLDLPDDLPPEVGLTAVEVTAGATTNFDRVLALQDWFRNTFRYDTNIPSGHGSSAILTFLRDKVGYCEQFAGTFAAMARTLGIPARVSVGFTQGQLNEQGLYQVHGRNAHAWPEVWFDGFGWVPFEPTPGRGLPGAEAYTGVEPPLDAGATPTAPATTTTTLPPTTTTVAGQTPPPPDQTPTTAPPPPEDREHSGGGGFPWLFVLLGSAAIGLLVALPELVRRWRRRRRGPITDPVQALLDLWDRAVRALAAMGFRGDSAQTPVELSARAAAAYPHVAVPLHELAVLATAASFAPQAEVATIAEASWRNADHEGPQDWCETIETIAEDSLGLRERVRRHFTIWH